MRCRVILNRESRTGNSLLAGNAWNPLEEENSSTNMYTSSTSESSSGTLNSSTGEWASWYGADTSVRDHSKSGKALERICFWVARRLQHGDKVADSERAGGASLPPLGLDLAENPTLLC
jgi:hypothetical protein